MQPRHKLVTFSQEMQVNFWYRYSVY